MALAYWIVPASRLVMICGWNTVTAAESVAMRRALHQDTRFDPTYRELIDHRRVMTIEVSDQGLQHLGILDSYGASASRAFVAPNDIAYNLARVYQLIRRRTEESFEVFRSWLAALDWLGLTEASLPRTRPDWWTRSSAGGGSTLLVAVAPFAAGER